MEGNRSRGHGALRSGLLTGISTAAVSGSATAHSTMRSTCRTPSFLGAPLRGRSPSASSPLASQALTNFAYMGGFVITPLLLENEFGYTTRLVGFLVIARPLSFAITAPLGSRFTIRTGERLSGTLGAGIVLGSMLVLAMVPSHPDKLLIIFGLALSGIGLGLASPALTSTTTSWPRATSSRAPAGVSATRASCGLISLTTPIFTPVCSLRRIRAEV